MATTVTTINQQQQQHVRCKAERAVKTLLELQISLLALDFDLTVLDFHTGGRPWQGTIPEMCQRIRPIFCSLIPLAYDAGIQIAIVTFSPQVKTISRVLENLFPNIASSIPIRGSDRSWSCEGLSCMEGKQPHMASAVEEVYANCPEVHITRKSTLLVDDDVNNVRVALNNGVRAIWFDPKRPNRLFDDIESLLNTKRKQIS